jgi:hypothetical protein
MSEEPSKTDTDTDPGPAGWAAVVAGLVAGWLVWRWRAPTGDEINAAGAGAFVPVGFAIYWAIAAFVTAAWAVYSVLKALGGKR